MFYIVAFNPDQYGSNGYLNLFTLQSGGPHNVEMGLTKTGPSGDLRIWSGNREGGNWGYGDVVSTGQWYNFRLHGNYTGSGYPYEWHWETYLGEVEQNSDLQYDSYASSIEQLFVGAQYGAVGAAVGGSVEVIIDTIRAGTTLLEEPPADKEFYLNISSTPEIYVDFLVNTTAYQTPETELNLTEGSYVFNTPATWTYGGINYDFAYWLVNSTQVSSRITQQHVGGNTTLEIHYTQEAAPPWVPPVFVSDGVNATWYFRSDTHTVHEILGYKLSSVQSFTPAADNRTTSGTANTSYGVRVWILSASGELAELTSGTPVAIVTRTSNGSGTLTGSWICPTYNNIIDAVLIRIYHRWNEGSWTLRVVSITRSGLLIRLPENTWVFHYHVSRYDGSTNSSFHWGSQSYLSRVILQYYELNPFETMTYHLIRRDLLAFLFAPWTYYIGDLFWGLIVLFFSVTTYNRYHSLRAVLAIMWLFGGVGGILSAMLPAVALNISWLLLALALAITFVKLLR